jgi:hypothetical protein
VVGADASPDDLLAHIRSIFKTIALRFLASMASDAGLGTEADQVARRLHALRDGAVVRTSSSSKDLERRTSSSSRDARRLSVEERGLLRSAFRGWASAPSEGGGLAPDDGIDVHPGLHHEARKARKADGACPPDEAPESSEGSADQVALRYPAVFDAGRVDEEQEAEECESGDGSV